MPALTTRSNTHYYITLEPSGLDVNLEPLTYDRYWRFALVPSNVNHEFCKEFETVSLVTDEFKAAQNNYPIAFFRDGNSFSPHAILSILPKINLALRNNNEWRKELYIPESINTYPFGIIDMSSKSYNEAAFSDSLHLLGEGEKDSETLLGIVPRNSMMVPTQENHPFAHPLFLSDGSITPYVADALKIQSAYKHRKKSTKTFTKALGEYNMLVKRSITLRFKDETKVTIDGFYTASKSTFSNLPSDVVARWKQLGYLDLLEQHWVSLNRWSILMKLHERHLNRALKNLRQS